MLSLAFLFPTSMAAQELDGQAIRTLIAGRTMRLTTSFGISLPLAYSDDGIVVGDTSEFAAATAFAPRERGRWWIDGHSLCQKWPTWYDGRVSCFRINSFGNGQIAWLRDDGAHGIARIEP